MSLIAESTLKKSAIIKPAFSMKVRRMSRFQNISVKQLHDMLKKSSGEPLLVLDVREHWEYTIGHVPGAVLIPMHHLTARVSELNAAQPVAVICEHGVRSEYAAAFLTQAGFEAVYNVLGGTSAWVERDLPVER
jgi:rhodanese-related sulfurtransferase